MTTRIFTIEGMTCGHCVAAVTSEVEKVPGISRAVVDLEQKTLTVTGDFDDALVVAAVDEAGYAVI